jgi:hypothetical protein
MSERRFWRCLWLAALGLGIASAFVLAADQKDPETKPFQEYHLSFKEKLEKDDSWDFYGPDGEQCVHFEPEGLRIALPTGQEKVRDSTGVVIFREMKGDFEIIMDFEVLKEPKPADTGFGTRLTLELRVEAPEKVTTLSRMLNSNGKTEFTTWSSMPNLVDGKPRPTFNEYPTAAKKGRLRMVRTGSVVSYAKAEGAASEFTTLHQYPFSAEDVKEVQIYGTTGGPKAELAFRVTDLRIRAESLPGLPAAATTTTAESKSWLVVGEILGLGIVLAVALGLGVWLYLRQSRRVENMPASASVPDRLPKPEAAQLTASFSCVCGKNLKAKAELAGKKVKCSQCGQPVLVPEIKADEADRITT